jgi:hypothetical protein
MEKRSPTFHGKRSLPVNPIKGLHHMIPGEFGRGIPPAPDQIFNAGFRDGLYRRVPHVQFQNNLNYLKGYVEGCRSVSSQDTFVSCLRSSNLNTVLQCFQNWEIDQERFGIGTIALGYRGDYWIVLVSQDLYEKALPF